MIYNINKIETILASIYLTLYNLRLVYYIVPTVIDTCIVQMNHLHIWLVLERGGRGPSKRSRTSTFFSSRGPWSTSCYEVFMRSDNFYINRSALKIHHVVPQHHKIARGQLNELAHVV